MLTLSAKPAYAQSGCTAKGRNASSSRWSFCPTLTVATTQLPNALPIMIHRSAKGDQFLEVVEANIADMARDTSVFRRIILVLLELSQLAPAGVLFGFCWVGIFFIFEPEAKPVYGPSL